MATVAIRLSAATKSYQRHRVLDAFDLTVERGEQLVVVGPSGCGKSTMLRVLAGLEALDSGRREYPDGSRAATQCLATVLQRPLLLPWLTVRENIALGGRYRANAQRFDGDVVEELVALLGIAELADALPDELSGGQAQRVAIARAMAVRPEILLLDEPFSALDPATRRSLQSWLRDTIRTSGLTLVLVTHDVDEALYFASSVVALDGSGTAVGRWRSEPAEDHDALSAHPLRGELLASYRSQVGSVPVAS
jgi:ABC-type nitrate/sulfonate/bicarbonate transport system ATPase subunit